MNRKDPKSRHGIASDQPPATASGRPRSTEQSAAGVTALARGLSILDVLVGAGEPLGNQEIASRTGLAKATVSRLTQTLVLAGYLNHDSRAGRYGLGSEALSLGYAALSGLDVRRIARPVMQRLADAAGFNVGLALRSRDWMVYTDTVEGGALINLRLVPGSRVRITTSAIGRAYLAALPEQRRRELLSEIALRQGSQEQQDVDRLTEALAEFRQVGFCSSIGEWQPDISAVAAPIPTLHDQGPYALNVGGPSYLLPPERLRSTLGPMVAAAALEIAGLLR